MMQRGGSKATAFLRSVLLLGLVVVATPVGLMAAADARFGGRAPLHGVPAPSDWEASRIREALTDRLTDQTVADVVIRTALVVAWAAIIVLVVTIVAEIVHMLRHDGLPMPDVRGLGMSQSLARVIAAGLLVVIPMFTSPSRAIARDGSVLVPTSRAATASIESGPARPDNVWPDSEADVAFDERTAAPARPDAGSSQAPVGEYVVRAGDSIYAIAEREAGPDPIAVADYAERLLETNLGRSMPDGQRFTNAAYIEVGWVLELPGSVPAAGTEASDGRHVVERGESLWSIADDELGDPQRWPEIFDANEGRTFDDGRTLSDPDLIHPGWDLEVPGRADERTVADVPTPPVDRSSGGDVVAESSDVRDSGASDVDAALGPSVDDRPVDAPGDAVQVDQGRPDNVWDSRHRAPHDGSPKHGEVPPAVADRSASSGTSADGDEEPGARGARSLVTMGQAAMLSAGVLTLLAVRRRHRLRRARPRSRLPEPSARPAATERSLRSIDAGGRFERVDLAIRAAAIPLIEHEERVTAVLIAADGALQLLASGPVVLPSPWEGGGDRWSIPASVPIELVAIDAPRITGVTPTLVQLGRAVDGRDVYVDLEALEALEIGGPGDQADAVVAAIAATLAGSVLAEVTTLVGVGVPDDAFLGHRHHLAVRDVQRAFEAAGDAIGSTAAQSRSTFELRARVSSGEAWEPAVVLAGSATGTLTLPRSRTGLAVVSAAPIHGPSSRLAPDGDAWELLPAGIRLVPVGLEPDDIEAIAELVRVPEPEPLPEPSLSDAPAVVADSGSVGPEDDLTLAPVDHDGEIEALADVPTTFGAPAPPWKLIVRLLGPVEVADPDGSTVDFERSKTRELVAWLATHRDRSTRTNARTALWELDVRDATFANVVSEARRALARLVEPPEGEEWVGRTMTEALPLHDLVRTDADLLAHALDVARMQPPALAIETLSPAVDWIGGLPFEGTSYLWPDAEGITSDLVVLATSATTELAAHCLSVGDLDGVFRATGRGLRVLPGHEELIGLRMQAHARAGDHAGVRQEWESYERVITADPWSDGEPSPKLVELRRELLNPSR